MEKLDNALSKIHSLEEENKNLKETINRLEDKIDDGEAYERRDCLVLSGEALPCAEAGENTVAVAVDTIKNKLKLNISASDISTAH